MISGLRIFLAKFTRMKKDYLCVYIYKAKNIVFLTGFKNEANEDVL